MTVARTHVLADDLLLAARASTGTSRLVRRGWLMRRMLLGADLVGLAGAFAAAEALTSRHQLAGVAEEGLFLAAALPLWVLVAKFYSLYEHDEERPDHSTVDDAVGLFHIITTGAWLFFGACALTGLLHPGFARVAVFWGAAIVLVIACRAAARYLCRRQAAYWQNTVVVGAGEVGRLVARKLLSHPEYRLNLIGFVDGDPAASRGDEPAPILGRPSQLPDLVEHLQIERVVIAFSSDPDVESLELIRLLKDLDVQIDIVPRLFEIVGVRAGLHALEGLPLISLPTLRLSRSSLLLKRAFDTVGSLLLLVTLLPLLLLLGILVTLDSPGPMLFRQERVGLAGGIFRIYKFRSMADGADQRKQELEHLNRHVQRGDGRMFKVTDDPRVTRVGKFLRRWSLDELPQLLNVLRGEMSLVGPRPLVLSEHAYVDEWRSRRVDLKPGITGPWQVVGRDEMPFDEMLNLDYHYVTGWSLFLDISLMIRTVRAVLRPRQAY